MTRRTRRRKRTGVGCAAKKWGSRASSVAVGASSAVCTDTQTSMTARLTIKNSVLRKSERTIPWSWVTRFKRFEGPPSIGCLFWFGWARRKNAAEFFFRHFFSPSLLPAAASPVAWSCLSTFSHFYFGLLTCEYSHPVFMILAGGK